MKERYYINWVIMITKVFEDRINFAYEQTGYWRKNLFLLPTGQAGKQYIDEISRLLNA